MKKLKSIHGILVLLFTFSLLISCSKNNDFTAQSNLKSKPVQGNQSLKQHDSVQAIVTPFGASIAYPRGLKFGPDGYFMLQ